MNRREFLRRTAVGVAALGAFSAERAAAQRPTAPGYYYLLPYTGGGKYDDMFEPRGVQGMRWSAHDEREDSTKVDGDALVWAENEVDDPAAIPIADDITEMVSNRSRRALERRLGVTIDSRRCDDVIAEIMMQSRPGRMPLKPNRREAASTVEIGKSGRIKTIPAVDGYWDDPLFERVFAELRRLFSVPNAYAQSRIEENWNCPDNATSLNCQRTWTLQGGGGFEWGISSNRAAGSGVGGSQARRARCDDPTTDTDHYAEGVIGYGFNNVSQRCSVSILARYHPTDQTFYGGTNRRLDADTEMFKEVGGEFTRLGSNLPGFAADGSVVRIEVTGSAPATIKLYDDTVEIRTESDSDAALASNLHGGIHGSVVGTNNLCHWDDFVLDVAGPPPVTGTVVPLLRQMGEL